jgi:hypothetical protein
MLELQENVFFVLNTCIADDAASHNQRRAPHEPRRQRKAGAS